MVGPLPLTFLQSRRVVVPGPMTAAEIWPALMARPLPGLKLAFRLRDAISARFGVQRIGGFSHRAAEPKVGAHLDFFLVEALEPRRMVLTARDSHLDVMICATANPVPQGTEIGLTASVRTHNRFGRLYMGPVGPAHRLIVWWLLWRLQRDRKACVGA